MKLSKEQFFSKLMKGEIKSFTHKGIKYFSESDYASYVIEGMLNGWKLIPNINFDSKSLSSIEKYIKENIPPFIEKNNNMAILDNGTIIREYIDPKHVRDYLNKIKIENFDVKVYTDLKRGTKVHCALILTDKRKDFERSTIKIRIEGGLFGEFDFEVENTFINIFYNNIKNNEKSFAVFNNLSHDVSELLFLPLYKKYKLFNRK